MKTSRYTSTEWLNKLVTSLVLMVLILHLHAQTDNPLIIVANDTLHPTDATIVVDTSQVSKYIETINEATEVPMLHGFTLSVDIFGPLLYAISDYGSTEAAIKVSLQNRYLPVIEVGYAKCKLTDDNTHIYYSTTAPFMRVGLDYNILKNKLQDNRLTIGLRYGLSMFKYDMHGPQISDPIWGGSAPFDYSDVSSTCHWAELVVGVQVKILKYFHMGWSIRYKKEMKVGGHDHSRPYYIPGYGTTTNSSCWGGTYNLTFDLRL